MTTETKDDQAKLQLKRIEILYSHSLPTLAIGMLNGFLYWNISRDFMPDLHLDIWLAVYTSIFVFRTCLQVCFNRHFIKGNRPFKPVFWERIFILGVLASGIMWGLAGSVFLPTGALSQHAFLGFLLAGTTAGAAVSYCTSILAMQAFLLPAIIPFAFSVAGDATKLHYCMSLLSFLYVGLITVLGIRLSRSILTSLSLQFENEKLLEHVRQAQSTITQTAKMVALNEMSGGVAHEINTPLTIINFETQSIRDFIENPNENPKTLIPITDRIDAMVARIAKIVVGLKAFSRESSRNQPMQMVSAKQLIGDTLDFCQNRIKSHGVTIAVKPNVSESLISCNSYKIIQALMNLINNAFDAVRHTTSGQIEISTLETPDTITFLVADNGSGIEDKIRDKIMQPFFTTKEVGEGAGLGLSVAMGIVASHNGKIDFESTNRGSTFMICLPKAQTVISSAV